jgi:hypothetical protein
MKPAAASARSLWLKLKLWLAMVQCGAPERRERNHDRRTSRRRTRTFFEMP